HKRRRSCVGSATPMSAGTSGLSLLRSDGSTGRSPHTPFTSLPALLRARSERGYALRNPRISVLILARDEEENLAECLHAARWADEIGVVVDAASQDRTEAIARELADIVAVRTFDDFASQRNAALDLSSGDWVFAIDADERATPALADEVRRATSD